MGAAVPTIVMAEETPTSPPVFEDVLSANLDVLWRTALRLCRGHEADAEDLLQDTAMRAHQAFGQLRHAAAARSWFLTIMTRHHLNGLRHRRRRPEVMETDLSTADFEAVLAESDPLQHPEQIVRRAMLREELTAALDSLSVELRTAVWLVDVEGLSMREAAEAMTVAEGTVASRLFRGRRRLRGLLQEER